MPTLLIELKGAQQAWGSRSRFATRGTEHAPTRSGVIGLLAAALGVGRAESLDRFDGLEFGVRIDQLGRVERDFQTARTLDGRASMPLSQRFYLADAVFLVGIGSPNRDELAGLRDALAHPVFPLYLGRRAFPPSGPIVTEIVGDGVREALAVAAWRATESYRRSTGAVLPKLEILTDAHDGERADRTLRDVPRSFDPRRRRYDWRDVHVAHTRVASAGRGIPHDPMLLVSEEEV